MEQHSHGSQVTVGETTLAATLADGQVRIHLPFSIDPQQLSRQLLREGFPLAHQPDTPDTQGWGQNFEANGYYPYWVYPDPEHPGGYVFAFNPQPEDVVDQGGRVERVELGERSQRLVQRWVPVLERLRRTEVH